MNRICRVACFVFLFSAALSAQEEKKNDPLGQLTWRNIGPLNMSGRVADVEGIPGDPRVVYVGSASGGIWKTTDGGVTFKPIFDDQPIASIGDMALAPSNHGVIYVGSGEGNPRNSVAFGNGVYKSTDGGAHWQHIGLEETRYISRVHVHPADPDTVFVGAIGHIYGPNEERGLFKSTDGGATWRKTLYIDDMHGVSDMDIDLGNPNILFAGMWLFNRKPWTHTSGSEEGGLFKSTDGGESWREITKGLPKLMGRIAVKIAQSNPDVVYVMAESNDGVLFRSNDGGESFKKVYSRVNIVSRGFYYTDIRVDPTDENRVYSVSSRMWRSVDGGKTFEQFSQSTHVDYHSLWIDPLDPNRIWQGQDGGIAVTYNRGDTWEPIRNLPLAQFYQIYADNRDPFYFVGGGLQDNGAWYGPVRTREPSGILPDDWRLVSFGDAYFMLAHPDNPEYIISESQGGGIVRTDMRTRANEDISPQPRRNDGGPVGELKYRFSWNAPIIASPHDKNTVYFCGNVVFKSTDFGDSWTVISPDLTTDDKSKQGIAGGPVWEENTTAEYHCTIISFAESEKEKGLLWSGSDDGKLYISRNGGEKWTDITANAGMPEFAPVSHVEPSRVKSGRAYVGFDRHMFDDQTAYILVTENYGKSFKRIDNGLPEGAWVWVVKEDPKNPDLLYAGTELGLFASYDRGGNWQKLHLKNFPTVSVHDVLIHPRDNDLILGTHGRAIWVFDDATPLQQFAGVHKKGKPHLFDVRRAYRFPVKFTRYGLGDKVKTMPNPPFGALITYYLPEDMGPPKDKPKDKDAAAEKPKPRVSVEILDSGGKVVRKLKKPGTAMGLNRVSWALDGALARARSDRDEGPSWWGPRRGPYVPAGSYKARLTVDGKSYETSIEVAIDPNVPFSKEDMEAQYVMTTTLRDLISEANDMLRMTDALEGQIGDRRETAKKLKLKDKALTDALKDFEKQMKDLRNILIRKEGKTFWSQGNYLKDNLEELVRNVNGAYRAPFKAQQDLLVELTAEMEAARKAYADLTEEALTKVNNALESAGAGRLMTGK
ncbi:MAG: hypothetical protein QNK37_29210 [Acidobacteriota bacterium]|nr:hypothetical protein [Acidobacteriota bacterium]